MKPLIHLFIVTVFCAAGVTLGQQPTEENVHRPRTINRNNWIGKRVLTKEFMKQVGLQNAQAEKLKADLEAIHAESQKLEESINRDALQQAEVGQVHLEQVLVQQFRPHRVPLLHQRRRHPPPGLRL